MSGLLSLYLARCDASMTGMVDFASSTAESAAMRVPLFSSPFSTVGCSTLPSPRPSGYPPSWNLTGVNSTGGLARAWSLPPGPLTSCKIFYLDCATARPGRKVRVRSATDHRLPQATPPRRRPANGDSEGGNAVSVGSHCHEIQHCIAFPLRFKRTGVSGSEQLGGTYCSSSGVVRPGRQDVRAPSVHQRELRHGVPALEPRAAVLLGCERAAVSRRRLRRRRQRLVRLPGAAGRCRAQGPP